MKREELELRREELYDEIQEINDKINELDSIKYKEYVGKYFRIKDEDEYTIGKVISCTEFGLKTMELACDYELEAYTYSTGTRDYNELKFITEEDFLEDKSEFIIFIEQNFI